MENDTVTVGDLHSKARGTGARKSSGKVALELLPLGVLHLSPVQMVVTPFHLVHALALFQGRRVPASVIIQAALAYESQQRETNDRVEWWRSCCNVLRFGAQKYAAWNWAKGMPWSVPLACGARHALAIQRGTHLDAESHLPHLGHYLCNAVFLWHYERCYREGDDRPRRDLFQSSRFARNGSPNSKDDRCSSSSHHTSTVPDSRT